MSLMRNTYGAVSKRISNLGKITPEQIPLWLRNTGKVVGKAGGRSAIGGSIGTGLSLGKQILSGEDIDDIKALRDGILLGSAFGLGSLGARAMPKLLSKDPNMSLLAKRVIGGTLGGGLGMAGGRIITDAHHDLQRDNDYGKALFTLKRKNSLKTASYNNYYDIYMYPTTSVELTEKQAGLGSKLRSLLTGRTTLVHGTSPQRAQQIAKKGLQPNVGGGISGKLNLDDANQGLVFLNRGSPAGKADSMTYAAQQRYLEEGLPGADLAKKIESTGWLPGPIREGAKNFSELSAKTLSDPTTQMSLRPIGNTLQKFRPSTRQGLIEARVPLWKKEVVPNPEIAVAKDKLFGRADTNQIVDTLSRELKGKLPSQAGRYVDALRPAAAKTINKGKEFVASQPFRQNVVVKGGIDPQYLGGGRNIGDKAKETMDYWRWAKENPTEALQNALRYG